MRLKVVLHYIGLLIAGVGFSMFVPLACSIVYRESDWLAFVISIGISMVSGLLIWRLTLIGEGEGKVSQREAIMLVAGGWILASAFGALPYVFAGTFHSYLNAYFESMSGFTATGATVITSIESQTHGILLWRSFSQWLGGMGIITLFVALFPMLGMGAAHLVEAEMSGLQTQRLTARIRDAAKTVWFLYLIFSFAEVASLAIAGMPLFDSLAVTFSTMATGGFTPTNASVGAYNSLTIESIVIIFMVLAGTNFGLYYFFLWKRQPGRLFKNAEFQLYLAILVGASLFVALDLIINGGQPVGEAFRYGSFNTISVMTTTGFVTADFNLWPAFSKTVLLILMIIGGSAGSTSGAIKVIRLLVLSKYIYRRIRLSINPRTVIPLKVGGSVVSEEVVSKIISMSTLYIAFLTLAFLALTTMGIDQVTAVSAVATNMGTVGPGLGAVGPMVNYLWVPSAGKIILMLCMLVGRLELFTVLALFTPTFWKWR
jgi:trk system potassium uptake protein TrkH